MDNVIKYVKKRVPGTKEDESGAGDSGRGETPYLTLDDTVSVNKYSADDSANYSTLRDDSATSATNQRDDNGTF